MFTTDVVSSLAKRLNTTEVESKKALTEVLTIIATMEPESEISLRGFGKFKRYLRKSYRAYNPSTGGHVQVPRKEALTFIASPKVFQYGD